MENVFAVCRNSHRHSAMFLASYIPVNQDNMKNFYVPAGEGVRVLSVTGALVTSVSKGRGFGIIEASFRTGKVPSFIQRSIDETATLLWISSFEGAVLNIDGLSRPHFKKTEVWVGADGLQPLYMSGKWDNPNKKQLFALVEGQKIFFCDTNREVTCIIGQKCGEPPKLTRALDSEVSEYLLEHARVVGRENLKTRAWCAYAILELGVQKYIDGFSKLFPDFSYRVR